MQGAETARGLVELTSSRKELHQEESYTMMKLTDMKQEVSNASCNGEEDEFITPHIMDDFDSQALIKEEESDGMRWSHQKVTFQTPIKGSTTLNQEYSASVTSFPTACNVKTEHSNEEECEGKNTVDHPFETVIKQELIEDEKEYSYLIEDRVKISKDEGSGAETNHHTSAFPDVKPENDDLRLIIPDVDTSEHESMSDTNEDTVKQEKHRRVDAKKQTFQKSIKILDNTDKTLHACSLCGKVFEKSRTYLQHMKFVHTSEKPYTCKTCGKGFKCSRDLRVHERTHSNERPYSCELCGKTFKQRSHVGEHKRQHHSDERPYACDLCEKAFKQRGHLREHKAACHSNERPHSCDLCGKTFSQKAALWAHKTRYHLNERPFACDQCEKCFKQKDHLQEHKTQCHSDERPYSCDQCEKTFKRKTHLLGHKTQCHSNERPYSCDLCDKTFKQKSHVLQHKASCHSQEKPYSCDVCGKAFNHKGNLRRHKETCHLNEGSPSGD